MEVSSHRCFIQNNPFPKKKLVCAKCGTKESIKWHYGTWTDYKDICDNCYKEIKK